MADSSITLTDGSLDFSGGVDSVKVTTIQSAKNPNGLSRNELAWLNNGTVRDGGITTRAGWQPICKVVTGTFLFQGKFLYQPLGANPYQIYSVSGRIIKVDTETHQVTDLSGMFGLFNSATSDYAYFVQAEQFLVIQSGDLVTLPLIWDGTILRRSKGITNTAVAPGTPGVNEIPAAGPMDYFMGRLWYAQGRQVSAGDIVRGPSGTLAYNFTDAVLNVTESPMVLQGDGFTVPSESGNIRAVKHSANIDAALGQGRLFVSTIKAIYALNVPVTRTDWIASTNNNQPLMTVVQLSNGWVNDRSVVAVNGDLFGQSLEPGIRSLNQCIRYFNQWGNIQISANEQRILQYNNRALLRFSSGIYFDNRLIETQLPVQTDFGVVSQALIPLDFVPISSFNSNQPPNWEGMYEGLDIFQVNSGDFGGRERAFATVLSRTDQSLELWELTDFLKKDLNYSATGDNRVTMIIETPAFTWGDEQELKKLTGAEFWVDRLDGTAQFILEYRPDGQACWNPWHAWKKCSTSNSVESVTAPAAYPINPCLESYVSNMTVPAPNPNQCAVPMGRPGNIGYQFQVRLTIKGFCRVRGIYLFASIVERKMYANLTC